MINTPYKNLRESGDTIVEVLIAIAVVGVVLVASFTISNESLRHIRVAQERSIAQKVAQQQVESLDSLTRTDANLTSSTSVPLPFCVSVTFAPIAYTVLPDTNALCTSGIYKTSISRVGTPQTFNITVSWLGLDDSNQKLVINYRVREVPTP